MSDKIEILRGNTLYIEHDDDACNPREEFDHLCKMACFHRNYSLGDYHEYEIDDLTAIASNPRYYSLPLYLYDHSGITISTKPFSCIFDSGQIGLIYVQEDRALAECPKLPNESENQYTSRIQSYMVSEVQEYDAYLTGQVYCYVIKDDNDNVIDSCCGFYDYDHAKDAGIESLKSFEPKQTVLPFVATTER